MIGSEDCMSFKLIGNKIEIEQLNPEIKSQ